jgi:formamidopyrimidine-DNA glycosylase
MPELPEIEVSRQRLDPKILARPVMEVVEADERILRQTTAEALRQGLVGRAFSGLARFGNFLLFELTDAGGGPAALLLSLSPAATIEQVRPQEEPPRHGRLVLRFNDGGGLAVVDPRNQSWVTYLDDEAALPELGAFGPDALNGEPEPEAWWQTLQARRAQIKGVLLDASVIAGLGPVFADEILFQAGIRPERKASELSRDEAERLRQTIGATLAKAVRCQAIPGQMPKTFLVRSRDEGSEICPRCGGELEKRRIQGRATPFCPACQS